MKRIIIRWIRQEIVLNLVMHISRISLGLAHSLFALISHKIQFDPISVVKHTRTTKKQQRINIHILLVFFNAGTMTPLRIRAADTNSRWQNDSSKA